MNSILLTSLKIFYSFFANVDFFYLHKNKVLNYTSVSHLFQYSKNFSSIALSAPMYVPSVILNSQHLTNVMLSKHLFCSKKEIRLIS